MSRTVRMFEIIQLLRSANKPITAHVIAEQLEITKRTVYRDIVALQSMRVPIEGEAGIGYIMRAGFDLPPLMFSSEEVETISLALALLDRTGDTALKKTADNIIQKIADVLPQAEKSELQDTTVFASAWHAIPKSTISAQVLRQSIREEKKLSITYLSDSGDETTRTVQPLAMVYYVESVVMAAWCELRDDFRHFRVDRISHCAVSESRFAETGYQLREQWRIAHQIS